MAKTDECMFLQVALRSFRNSMISRNIHKIDQVKNRHDITGKTRHLNPCAHALLNFLVLKSVSHKTVCEGGYKEGG